MRVQSGLGVLSATTGGGSLVITTSSLPAATQGTPYSTTLAASGGSGTYVNWTVIGGSLPAFDAGPLPLPGIALNFTGIVQGMPYLPGSGSATFQVRDSAGNTAQTTLDWTVDAAAPAISWKFSSGNEQPTYIDPENSAQWLSPNAWNGGSGQAFLAWGARRWIATVPPAYSEGNIQGYPFATRGFYPQGWVDPCIPANGGSSTAPGVASAIQISAITQAALRSVVSFPIDRTVAQWDGLKDVYVVSAATPAAGVTGSYTVAETLSSISLFNGHLDTTTYWETFIGTANSTAIAKATLVRATDYVGTGTGGLNSTAYYGCVELDGRMCFVALANEDWAATPASGKCNTVRIWPAPWNELHQVGSMYLNVDLGRLLRDLLASSLGSYLNFTSADFLANLTDGNEPDGLGTHYNLTAATQTNPLTFTVAAPPQFSVNDRVAFAAVGGMTQLDEVVGTVSSVNATTGVVTLGDVNASGFSAFTSGGYAHKAVLEFDTQTAMQTDAPPLIYTVPEISQNISRQPTHVPVSASADAGGVYVAANAITANYNLWWQSNAKPTTGSPVYYAMNFNGISPTLKKYGLLTWSAPYLDQNGNSDFYVGAEGSDWLMGDYTIDVNPSTSSTYPTTGWTTLVTVTGNGRRERAHFFGDWSAYNWLRINCTALAAKDSQDSIAFHVDVLNAPNTTGMPDGWFFLGDSIVNKVMLPGDTEEGGASDFFGSMVYNYTGHIPIGQDAGNSGWTLCGTDDEATMPWIDGTSGTWLADFPGRYVWYGLGYNDGASEAVYCTTLAQFLNIALALGQTVVVPSIWYTKSDSGADSTLYSGYNASLVNLAISGSSGPSLNGTYGTVNAIGGSTSAWTVTVGSTTLTLSLPSTVNPIVVGQPVNISADGSTLTRPQVIGGPDLNTIGKDLVTIMMNSHDTIHPSPYGQAMFRAFVTDWIARCIYLGQDPATWAVPYVLGTGTYGMGGIAGSG